MAGLYIREMILRGEVERCLIVAPGGLVAQWQDELQEKFDLHFDIVTRDAVEASYTGNPFADKPLLIARLDQLARNEATLDRAIEVEWDLVIFDEAHRLAAHAFPGEIKRTRRYEVGQRLGEHTRNLLLMTATPHAGKEEDFQLWLALLDSDRFEGSNHEGAHVADVKDLMCRRVKEHLTTMDGDPLFPRRVATTLEFELSKPEVALYEAVTEYVREEMNRAERLSEDGDGKKGNMVGFALTVLQRRLASSPEAIFQSIARRRMRLEKKVAGLRGEGDRRPIDERLSRLERLISAPDAGDGDPYDDLDVAELEQAEEAITDDASTARTVAEMETETLTLQRLEGLAKRVRDLGTDTKWSELSKLFDLDEMRAPDGTFEKLIVFTEHRDTLNYLRDRLTRLFGRPDAVVTIHGGTAREERKAIQGRFTDDPACAVLVATDAAGEGINLQRAHLMVNYDLPWNPNRLEQRFGRVHRIGQRHVCHLWNMVAGNTREGAVYLTLLHKLAEQQAALGTDQVFDVLGEAFQGRSLRDLLIEAVRFGDDPVREARVRTEVDDAIGENVGRLIAELALDVTMLDHARVAQIRRDMEDAYARRLQPHYVRRFFGHAFERFGGKTIEHEQNRFEVTRVPLELRSRGRLMGIGEPLQHNYHRICFDKSNIDVPGAPLASLVCPGHPLLDTVVDLSIEKFAGTLRLGAVFVDDDDHRDGEDALRVLVGFDHEVVSGRLTASGQRTVVSKRFEFVTIDSAGGCSLAGAAPYLDVRPATDDERELVAPAAARLGSPEEIEARALAAVVDGPATDHLIQVRLHRTVRLDKVRAEVQKRLRSEIEYWDHRANVLADEVAKGKQPKMNASAARERADEISARRNRRMAEIDADQQFASRRPDVAAIALVVPAGMLRRMQGLPTMYSGDAAARAEVQHRAERAVIAAEDSLGHDPTLLAQNHPGYDIRSIDRAGGLRFVEVKGRVAGAETFSVTCNEILTALNVPEQYILALVEVSPAGAANDCVRYVRKPFTGADAPFEGARAVQFHWDEMWQKGSEPS
jgi:superfamily II DNA or RNA helicase